VTSPASVLQVLAPPGSGKTKTLTARVAYLVNHEQLQPWNIVVCTFTIKAAREMKERIRSFVGEGIEKKLILGTFHSVARRFLVRYGQEIGIPKNFGIADTGDSKAIIKRIVQRQQYLVEPSHARSRISGLKARNISAAQFATTQKKAEDHEFACIFSEYEEHLNSQNLLDYDDLLMRCVELLQRHPTCVSTIQAVLIDEYQDTNNVQYELMKLLAQYARRITIVGDPDQSIYSFRAAEIKNLFRMRNDYPDSLVVNLEMNYRSSGCILSSAMAVIEQDDSRMGKALVATHCVGEQPTLRHLVTASVEAKWIVEEIQRTKALTAGLLNYNDYAILIRSATLSLLIEKALGNAGIPYRMVGGMRFFDRAEIKIVLDYLRVINQPECNDALVRVINLPSRKIGESTVRALLEEAEKEKTSLWALILGNARGEKKPQCKISKPAQVGIDIFVNLILTSRQKLMKDDECNLLTLIGYILQKIQFEAYLREKYKENWKDRWANVEELVSQATQLATTIAQGEEVADDALPVVAGVEQRADTAADILSKFLANVALSSAVEQADGEEANQVTISTIHAAKGLEWPVVFIPAVYDGSIPHSRAEDHDEERRLLYVGMTRAQGLLYLSCPVKHSSSEDTTLSKFVSPHDIQKLFGRCGPSIGCSAIQDLARILRRGCPLATDVSLAQSSLERIEDDKYPFTRDEVEGGDLCNDLGADNDGNAPSYKRRRFETTMTLSEVQFTTQEGPNHVVSTIKRNSGFTTARGLKSLQDEAERIRMLESAANAASGRQLYNVANNPGMALNKVSKGANRLGAKPGPTKKTKARIPGQGAITAFFQRSESTLVEKQEPQLFTSKEPPVNPLASTRPLVDISDKKPTYIQNIQPYKPPSVPKYNLRNVPMASRPAKRSLDHDTEHTRYVLLSSSPTKPDESQTVYTCDDKDNSKAPTSPIKHSPVPNATSGFRPASTFHTTSMSQLQNHSSAQRRTLGTRRTMQGWSVKHNAPPRPQQL